MSWHVLVPRRYLMRHHHFSAASTKYFERTSGHFPVMFVPTISDIFYVTSGQLLAYYILYYGHNKIRHFKLKHDLFQSLTKYFLCLNLTRPQAQNCHNTNWKRKVLKFILVTGLSVFYRFTSCLINKSISTCFLVNMHTYPLLCERETHFLSLYFMANKVPKKKHHFMKVSSALNIYTKLKLPHWSQV